jgi:hypothetical protein
MDKTSRELIRMARGMGIDRADVIRGSPHGRLVGTYKGKHLSMVVTVSKGKFDSPNGHAFNKSLLRKALRKLEDGGDVP